MQLKERLLHMVLFEIGAMLVGMAAIFFGSGKGHSAMWLGIALAVVAMACNFFFNWFFDKIFTGKREERGAIFRLFHTVAFEATLLILTVPMFAYALDLTLWQAFLADIAITLIIMVYTFIFNWAYDLLRLRFVAA